MSSFKFDEEAIRRVVGQAAAKVKINVACPFCKASMQPTVDAVAAEQIVTCTACGRQTKIQDQGGSAQRLISGQY